MKTPLCELVIVVLLLSALQAVTQQTPSPSKRSPTRSTICGRWWRATLPRLPKPCQKISGASGQCKARSPMYALSPSK